MKSVSLQRVEKVPAVSLRGAKRRGNLIKSFVFAGIHTRCKMILRDCHDPFGVSQ